MSAKGYLVVEAKVSDPEAYARYRTLAAAAVETTSWRNGALDISV